MSIVAKLRRLTYANVVGTLALFVALGGVSYAAATLPARSVGTRELKTDAVTSAKVRDGSLGRRDFQRGQLPRGKAGEAGQAGQPGDAGAPGARGAPGAKGATGAPGERGPGGATGPAGGVGGDGPAGTSGPVGPAGPTGAVGAAGPAGAIGPQGATGGVGPQGPTGVVTTARISGFIASTAPDAAAYQFLGTQAVVTTTSTQRVTGSAMVPVGVTGASQTIRLDLCYQPSVVGGALTAFSGGNYSLVAVTTARTAQAVAGTVVPGAGTWRVGACAMTTVALDNNDFVNGYVQVTS
jgi:hypothetical protein